MGDRSFSSAQPTTVSAISLHYLPQQLRQTASSSLCTKTKFAQTFLSYCLLNRLKTHKLRKLIITTRLLLHSDDSVSVNLYNPGKVSQNTLDPFYWDLRFNIANVHFVIRKMAGVVDCRRYNIPKMLPCQKQRVLQDFKFYEK